MRVTANSVNAGNKPHFHSRRIEEETA